MEIGLEFEGLKMKVRRNNLTNTIAVFFANSGFQYLMEFRFTRLPNPAIFLVKNKRNIANDVPVHPRKYIKLAEGIHFNFPNFT